MAGSFGLLTDNHSSHFPADHFVENRSRLDVFQLRRIGALTEGVTTEVLWREKRYHLARQGADLLVDGIRILVTWTDWECPWFTCPACARRCKHLYLGEFLCRTCCRIDYASRHQHRSIPGLYRIKQLRRRIGVDERPFSPLPARQRHHLRYYRIADEIAQLESRLVIHLAGINRDLQRRIRVRRAKGEW
jgi:hypothetical protein